MISPACFNLRTRGHTMKKLDQNAIINIFKETGALL